MIMKVYLDDERSTPEGWTRVYWPAEAIELLRTGEVEEISLDNDLGDDDHAHPPRCVSARTRGVRRQIRRHIQRVLP